MGKIRLDALLVKNGQVQSRERAKALIMAGQVYVKNQKCDKAGQMVDEDTTVAEIRGETLKYVSSPESVNSQSASAPGTTLRTAFEQDA